MTEQEIKPWEQFSPSQGTSSSRYETPVAVPKPREAPNGYRYNAQGGLEPIPGGPADPNATKSLNEGEAKAVGFYQRMRSAETQMKRLGMGPQDWSTLIQQRISPTFSRANLSDRQRTQLDLMENWIAASMRLESGASIAPDEFEKQARIFFPQPGAGPEEQSSKDQQRELAILGFKAVAGPGAKEADANLRKLGFLDENGNPIIGQVAPKVDAQGREIVAPEIRVAEGAEFSTDADFKRQRDSAEAWAATQGLPFDQALAQFNASMQAKGYGPAGQETVDILRLYEKGGDRGAVRWELPKTGVREAQAPGMATGLASGLVTGGTAGLAEEAVRLFDPTAAAKLEAAKQYAREQQPGAELTGEIIGGLLTPLSRVGPGGTIIGEATRGAVYGGLMGGGEAPPEAGLLERLPQAAIGAGLGGLTGGVAQRFLGGRVPTQVEIPPTGGAPEVPTSVMAPEVRAAGMAAPEAPSVAPVGVAEEVVVTGAEMTPQEIGDLARKAVGRGPGSAKAKSQLATLAKSNPEAVAAADRLGLELPVDVLSDNAQLRSLTGLARSEVGSEAETAWGETARSVIQRANQAMDELGATPDLTQVSADVFKRVDDAQQALGKQAGLLREEVEATFNITDRVEPSRIREWLQGRINELGGGKEGLAALSPEEKKLWGVVSKGQPTYARLNEARDLIGQALNKGTGPWADANLSRVKQLYGALADDQINFIEATAGKEVADKQRAANTLFQEMYKGREQMQDIFGKDLSKSLVPLMQRAITSGTKGDISALNQLVSAVPEDMRGTVLTSALFNAAKTRAGARGADEMFSFTNFSKIYRDLRDNKEVYKQIAKSVGPEGDRLLTDLYAISRRMADAESRVLKTGKANQALDNSLNAERLLNRVLKGAGGRLAAYTIGGVAGGPIGAAAAGGLAEGAQHIGKGMGKNTADKVHALLSGAEFRNLIETVGSGGNTDQAINRVAGSRPFIDYIKSIGIEAKEGKNWLRSAMTVAPVSGVTRQGESQQPVAAPPMTAQQ